MFNLKLVVPEPLQVEDFELTHMRCSSATSGDSESELRCCQWLASGARCEDASAVVFELKLCSQWQTASGSAVPVGPGAGCTGNLKAGDFSCQCHWQPQCQCQWQCSASGGTPGPSRRSTPSRTRTRTSKSDSESSVCPCHKTPALVCHRRYRCAHRHNLSSQRYRAFEGWKS